MYKAGIIVSSDRCYKGEMVDESGKAIKTFLSSYGYEVFEPIIVPDEKEILQSKLIMLCDVEKVDVVFTSGGTGFSPRDIVPEATLALVDRLASGIAEAIRARSLAITPNAMLSRAVAGIRNNTLIINLPGSPKGAVEGLEVVIGQLPHALGLLSGKKMDR